MYYRTKPQPSPSITLLSTVIKRAWESPLTPDERVQFMTVSKLVSKTWDALYKLIFAEDVHIPCESFYGLYFDRQYIDCSRCKRITFVVYDPEQIRPTKRTISYMRLDDMMLLTSLQEIRLIYHNSTFPDPYGQGFLSALPSFVPKLSISYTFSPDVPQYVIEHYRRHFERKSQVWFKSRYVAILEVNGASKYIAAIWESLFPSRYMIINDGKGSRKHLMDIETTHDTEMGISYEKSVYLSHRGARRKAAMVRALRATHGLKKFEFSPVQVNGTILLSTCPTRVPVNLEFPRSVNVGDLGYITESTFVPIFNAMQVHCIDERTVPAISSCGKVSIYTIHTDGACIDCCGTNLRRVSRAVKRLLTGAHRPAKILCFDPINDGPVRIWLHVNFENIASYYHENLFICEENIVLVTAVPLY